MDFFDVTIFGRFFAVRQTSSRVSFDGERKDEWRVRMRSTLANLVVVRSACAPAHIDTAGPFVRRPRDPRASKKGEVADRSAHGGRRAAKRVRRTYAPDRSPCGRATSPTCTSCSRAL